MFFQAMLAEHPESSPTRVRVPVTTSLSWPCWSLSNAEGEAVANFIKSGHIHVFLPPSAPISSPCCAATVRARRLTWVDRAELSSKPADTLYLELYSGLRMLDIFFTSLWIDRGWPSSVISSLFYLLFCRVSVIRSCLSQVDYEGAVTTCARPVLAIARPWGAVPLSAGSTAPSSDLFRARRYQEQKSQSYTGKFLSGALGNIVWRRVVSKG
ncbi:hypothetical protein LX36DRAFT_92184 [Colletotrichum falcatum]|nr:hypothetical protein LX36DRAFT_92184 [Colletotrichum falcatum]